MRAVRMLEHLFGHFIKHPEEIGGLTRKRIRKDGRHRAVCDYLAGMTDRYAINEYHRLFGVEI
jgi:dGTPase